MLRGSARRRSEIGPVAILGAGAVANAFGRRLVKERIPVVLWARSRSRARSLQRRLAFGSKHDTTDWARELADLEQVDQFIIAVSDRAIETVAGDLALALGKKKRRARAALHTSGYFDEGLLSDLAEVGFATGTLHPLVALPHGGLASELKSGSWFATSGDPKALRFAKQMARALGGRELELVGTESKRPYHAAAALLAGGLVALFDAVEEVLADRVVSRDRAREAFCDLARSALTNIEAQGPLLALTGPIVRGDDNVVNGHLEVLATPESGASIHPSAQPRALYQALSRRMLELAQNRGALTSEERSEIEAKLEP